MGRLFATVLAALAVLLAIATTAEAQSPLARGSTGTAVAHWQRQLDLDAVPGPDIAVDALFGPVTEGKTKAFQRWRGIAVDGVVGPVTRAEMQEVDGGSASSSSSHPAVLRRGSTGSAVKHWQASLNDWLHFESAPLREDGIFGPTTGAVTRDLQRQAGIAVDGIVGPRTRAALEGRTAA